MDITASMVRHSPRLLHWLGRLTGANREAEMALLDILCDQGRASIDVGAKTGMYSWRLLAHSSAVIAFEPNPELAGLLRAVFGASIDIHEVALSDRESTAELRLPKAGASAAKAGRGTIENANSLDTFGGAVKNFQVATRRLDDMAVPDAGFIKIDVEGHEMAVLAGAVDTIARCRPNLLVEANDVHAPDAVERLMAWAEAGKYTAWFVAGDKLHSMRDPGAAAQISAGGIENFILLPKESVAAAAIRDRIAQ